MFILEDIKGHITFRQVDASSSLSINVRGIEGLKTGFHGFHIHENGDCSDPGSHFNPEGVSFQIENKIAGFKSTSNLSSSIMI